MTDERLTDLGLVGGEIFHADDAAALLHAGCDLMRDWAAIKGFRAAFGNLLQGAGKLRLFEDLARVVEPAVPKEYLLRLGKFPKFVAFAAQILGEGITDFEALGRQANRGLHHAA